VKELPAVLTSHRSLNSNRLKENALLVGSGRSVKSSRMFRTVRTLTSAFVYSLVWYLRRV